MYYNLIFIKKEQKTVERRRFQIGMNPMYVY